MEPLASWVCRPVRRTGGRAPREGIKRNPLGSTLLALDAGLDLERNFAGIQHWAFRVGTAKPEWTVCFASVQVKDNRKFLLRRKEKSGAPRSAAATWASRYQRPDNEKFRTWALRWVDVTVGWVGINLAAVPPLHGRRSRGANGREIGHSGRDDRAGAASGWQ